MIMPLFDWQFLVVTAVALGAVTIVGWRMLPSRSSGKNAGKPTACAHCESGNAHATRPAQPTRTVTTPVVALRDLRETARQARH
jgi:hypothetical protein